jgi:nitrite reductase (NO-forming)
MFTHGLCKKLLLLVLVIATSGATLSAQASAATVEVHLDARRANIEVAPGVKMRAWTFNGTVPGPVVRATEGDTVEVTLTNSDTGRQVKCPPAPTRAERRALTTTQIRERVRSRQKCQRRNTRNLPTVHSVDFHAAKIAPNLAFRSVLPGESHTFSFQVDTPGVYMYHCGTGPMLEHTGMGMYGMIIVDPIEGRPPAEEIMLVQSEFYGSVKDGWLQSSYEAMQTEPPRYVAFNGTALKYATDPIDVNAGEPLRIYLVDAGPSLFTAFHVVGTIFDQYQPDGNPDAPMRNVSTQVIGPGGAGLFECILPEPGNYPFVSHSFRDFDKGAVGILRAK